MHVASGSKDAFQRHSSTCSAVDGEVSSHVAYWLRVTSVASTHVSPTDILGKDKQNSGAAPIARRCRRVPTWRG